MRKGILSVLVVVVVFFASQVSAQVLFTGKTSGKNNGSVYVFGTASSVDGVVSSNDWMGLVLGVSDKVDLVMGYGDMTALGKHFPYAAFGGVFGLPTKRLGFDAVAYQLFSVPHANRKDSSPVFGNSVVIVSKDVTIGGYTLTPYTGYTGNYALGPKDRFMTFLEPVNQLPVGVFMPVTKSWGLTAEYDYGHMKSFGLSLNYSFQYRSK